MTTLSVQRGTGIGTKLLSYSLATLLSLLVIHPWIDYPIPVVVNSHAWLYAVVASGLFGFALLFQPIHLALKCLVVYLFASCFLAQIPYLAFNAYFFVVAGTYLYLAFTRVDWKIILNFLCAAFWLEVLLVCFQLAGMDRLMNANRPEPVFLGTVMQYMRFATVLAVLTPFLLIKSKWYFIPIVILCVFSQSSTFALALGVFVTSYALITLQTTRSRMIALILVACAIGAYAIYDFGSFHGAIVASNGGRFPSWWSALQTWVIDTSAMPKPSPHLVGEFQWRWFLFGHGMDSFLPLFPIYKHDLNPFPQAHNAYIQWLWEIGIIGFGLIAWFMGSLLRDLYKYRQRLLFCGALSIATVLFFAFPDRMMQSALLLVAYCAFSTVEIEHQIKLQSNIMFFGSDQEVNKRKSQNQLRSVEHAGV